MSTHGDLRALYEELILDHARRPRNYGQPPCANRRAEGWNPMCGDRIELALELDGDVIRDVGFSGKGCAISTASASLLGERVKGHTVEEALEIVAALQAMVSEARSESEPAEIVGKLAVLRGVREFPARVKCATLAWHALRAALEGAGGEVTTEERAGSP